MKIQDVFCPVDFGSGDERAFAHALRIAAGAEGLLRVVHLSPSPPTSAEWEALPHVGATLKRWGLGHKVEIEKGISVNSDPLAGLILQVQRHAADLVVLATHARQGIARWILGSMCESLLRTISVPVLALPPGAALVSPETGLVRLERVLAPICSPPGPGRALTALEGLLTALEVQGVSGRLFHLEGTAQHLDAPQPCAGSRVEWELRVRGAGPSPEQAILAEIESWEPDLVVMSTQGPTGLEGRLLGSVTERILRQGGCALLAVPA